VSPPVTVVFIAVPEYPIVETYSGVPPVGDEPTSTVMIPLFNSKKRSVKPLDPTAAK
jgi:hypothetical protein